MSQPKVFEFAKEIGMETLALMDKIREWKLPVKSHMAELSPELIDTIRSNLDGGSQKVQAAPTAKKVARKKAPAKSAPAKTKESAASPASASAVKKVVVKKSAPVVRRKASDETEGESQTSDSPDTEMTAEAQAPAPSAKVMTRKKVVQESPVVENEESQPVAQAQSATQESAELEVAPEAVPTPQAPIKTKAAAPASKAPATPAIEVSTTPQAEVSGEAKEEQSVIEEKGHKPEPPVAKRAIHTIRSGEITGDGMSQRPSQLKTFPQRPASAGARIISTPPALQAAAPGAQSSPAQAGAPAAGQPRVHRPRIMREVAMTSDGPISGVKSEAPKRNIVGRMDLSRVAEMQKQRQPQGMGGGPGRPGPHRGNIRTGFVSSNDSTRSTETEFKDPSMIELEAARKKLEEKRRTKFGPAVKVEAANASISAKEREETPPAFTASEFRKREMVFQPKKKKGLLSRDAMKTNITTPKASKRIVKMYQTIKVSELAQELGIKVPQLMKTLITNGITATMNTDLDFDTVSLIVPEFGYEAQNMHKSDTEILSASAYGDLDAERVIRPPIVTIMGHVDHGKTTLLDTIRKSRVAAGEAGGITQHIGAYQVKTSHGLITFLDTPGHEAFTGMRARGANVTDVAIIVVAADDGVMPQTAEAINHAKAAGVTIIVAVNKVDKPGANPDKIKQQLTEFELVPEEWGGTTIFCEVSGLKGTGVDELLEQISLVAEIQELKANPKRSATGVVIESKVEKGRGNVATVLIKDGTLRVGEFFVVGTVAGKVRSLLDYQGKQLKEAGPSTPVEIMGLAECPSAGDKFDSVVDEKTASKVADQRKEEVRLAEIKPANKMTLEDLFTKVKMGETKELPVILKSDVAGSMEAILGMFSKLETSEVKVKVIHNAIGGINESDVLLAKTAGGVIVGFNVRPDTTAAQLAKQQGIEVKTYSIVYELIDDMKKALSGLLTPDVVENVLGHAEVRNTFTVPKVGTIAGCYVSDGKIQRNATARLLRDGKIIYTGGISSLKRFKDDAKEVQTGFECGIGIENFNDVKVGDVIEVFVKEEKLREL